VPILHNTPPRSARRPTPLHPGKPGLLAVLETSLCSYDVDKVLCGICKYIDGKHATVCHRFSAAWRSERKSIYVTNIDELQLVGGHTDLFPYLDTLVLTTDAYIKGGAGYRLAWDRILANSRLRFKVTVVKLVGEAPVNTVNILLCRYRRLRQICVANDMIAHSLYVRSKSFFLNKRGYVPEIRCAGFAPTAVDSMCAIRFSRTLDPSLLARTPELLFRDTVVFVVGYSPVLVGWKRYTVMRDMAPDFGGGKVRLAVIKIAVPIHCGQDALDILQAVEYALCILPSRPESVRLEGFYDIRVIYWPILENPARLDIFGAITRDVAQLVDIGNWIVRWAGYPAVQQWARHLYAPLCDLLRQLDDARWEVARGSRDECMHAIYRLFVAMCIRKLPEDYDGVAYRLVHMCAYLTPMMSYDTMSQMMGSQVIDVPHVDFPADSDDILPVIEYTAKVACWPARRFTSTLGGRVLLMLYKQYASRVGRRCMKDDTRKRVYEYIRVIMDVTEVDASSPLCSIYLESTVKKHQYEGALLAITALDDWSFCALRDTLSNTKDPVSKLILKEYQRVLDIDPACSHKARERRKLFRTLVDRGLWQTPASHPGHAREK